MFACKHSSNRWRVDLGEKSEKSGLLQDAHRHRRPVFRAWRQPELRRHLRQRLRLPDDVVREVEGVVVGAALRAPLPVALVPVRSARAEVLLVLRPSNNNRVELHRPEDGPLKIPF